MSPDIIGHNTPQPVNVRSLDSEELWILDTITTSIPWDDGKFVHIKYIQKLDEEGSRIKLIIKELINDDSISPDDDLSNEWKETNYFTYFYNKNKDNKIDSMFEYSKYDGLNWGLSYKRSYEYDEKGNNTEKTTKMTKEAKADGMLSSKLVYTYDKNNNLLSDFLYREGEKGDWKISVRDYFEYDDNNNLKKEERYQLENTTVHYKLDYTYDEKNNLIGQYFLYTNDNQNNYTTYSYDERGNLLTEKTIETHDISVGWDSISRYENKYNDAGLIEEAICYLWNNEKERYPGYYNYFS